MATADETCRLHWFCKNRNVHKINSCLFFFSMSGIKKKCYITYLTSMYPKTVYSQHSPRQTISNTVRFASMYTNKRMRNVWYKYISCCKIHRSRYKNIVHVVKTRWYWRTTGFMLLNRDTPYILIYSNKIA